ncbi:hypothetical protein HaLaN_10521, partial [Haematococcus lacustris]
MNLELKCLPSPFGAHSDKSGLHDAEVKLLGRVRQLLARHRLALEEELRALPLPARLAS